MKRLLLIVLPLLLIVGCSQKPIDLDNLRENEGVYYTYDANERYSGQVFSLYHKGKKEFEGYLKDGKFDSLWTYWHKDGLGVKKMEGSYKYGNPNGLWIWWHINGKKKNEVTYKDGKRDGKWTYWYEDGREIIPIIPEFVAVKGGTFKMGEWEKYRYDYPGHSVTVSDFNISKTEVTFEQYNAFCDATDQYNDNGKRKPDDNG